MSYTNRTSEEATVPSYGKELLGESYWRDPLTHEGIGALGVKAVTEEILAEQMRHRIFRFEHFDDASGYVVREMETTGSPTVHSYLKRA